MKIRKPSPALRFSSFTNNWVEKKIDEVLERVVHPVNVSNDKEYEQIGIRSHGKGIFYKEKVLGEELGNKRVFWIEEDLFIVNIVFAWELAIAKTTKKERGLIASHRFPMFKPKKDLLDLEFILHFFLRNKGKYILELASPGGAGRNKTLGQKEFSKSKIIIPENIAEQKKISSFLSSVDDKIKLLETKRDLLKRYKKGVMQQIFSQQIKFKDDNGDDYPVWQEKKLEELLDYDQPTKYIVRSTEYNDSYNTPVLTAGKRFILGYTNEDQNIFTATPVIIFDDFTMANKYVDFNFKVKSSAMKILKAVSEEVNLKYVYESMQMIRYPKGDEHKRFWISEYSKIKIKYPCVEEQKKIADFLSAIDDKIELVNSQLDNTQSFKKGLLQQMFV